MSKRYTDEQTRQWLESCPRKDIGAKVVIKSNNGNILLVKPDYKDTWQLPGGGVEEGEDPRVAAIRETKEETNIDIDANDLEIIDTVFRADRDTLILIYEYKKCVDEGGDYSVDDEEIEGYEFVPPNDVARQLVGYYKEFWDKYSS